MEVRLLGAHHSESATTRMLSLLVDDVLAIDAGGLTSSLSLPEQAKIASILLTHHHYDHIRDIPTFALNNYLRTTNVYGTATTIDIISRYLLDGAIYPKFTEKPSPESPALRLHTLEPYKEETIEGYKVLALPVYHSIPSVGYQITSAEGKSLFYSGDMGSGLPACCNHISAQLLIINLTLPDRFGKMAIEAAHLTPRLLKDELAQFRRSRGYLPPVLLLHADPHFEAEIEDEVARVARELEAEITLGYEGMRFSV